MQSLVRTITMVVCMVLPACSTCFGDEAETLEKAVQWLVKQQDESGAWKSKHYGAMKQGAALTSLALYSLSRVPGTDREEYGDAIEKAFLFLQPGTISRGRVANPDGSLDQPVYSTAMFLTAAHRFEKHLETKQVETLIDFLMSAQCVEERGFTPDNPNYGGWDVIGPDVMPGKTSGANVSVTRFVLEAFSCWSPNEPKFDTEIVDRVEASKRKAVAWLKRLHAMNSDGGFRFSSQPESALNKSQLEDGTPMSYGTATCDGLLAMHFGGVSGGDVWDSAWSWQKQNANASVVAGFEPEQESGWPDALQFYNLQTLAIATNIGTDRKWSAQIQSDVSAVIGDAQKDDGRFQSESALMREDDPLVATSFAIIALSGE